MSEGNNITSFFGNLGFEMKINPVAMALVALIMMMVFPMVAAGQEAADREVSYLEEEATVEEVERWDRLDIEDTTVLSRAEVVTGQTVHGIVLGVQVCAVIECDGPRSFVGWPTLGGIAGLGGSLYLTREGISPGHSSLINSATVWGGLLGLRTADLLRIWDERVMLATMFGQAVGVGSGIVLGDVFRPTSGDVALMNHGAIWASALYFMVTAGVLELDFDYNVDLVTSIVVPVVGASAGALVSQYYPMSRARVRVVSASGLVGALAGLALPFFILEEDLNPRVGFGGMTLGSLLGLGLGTYFTPGWDGEYREGMSMQMSLVPSLDGKGLHVGLGGTF